MKNILRPGEDFGDRQMGPFCGVREYREQVYPFAGFNRYLRLVVGRPEDAPFARFEDGFALAGDTLDLNCTPGFDPRRGKLGKPWWWSLFDQNS